MSIRDGSLMDSTGLFDALTQLSRDADARSGNNQARGISGEWWAGYGSAARYIRDNLLDLEPTDQSSGVMPRAGDLAPSEAAEGSSR